MCGMLVFIATGASAPTPPATTRAPFTGLFAEDGADSQQGTYQKNGDDECVCHNVVSVVVFLVCKISVFCRLIGIGAHRLHQNTQKDDAGNQLPGAEYAGGAQEP